METVDVVRFNMTEASVLASVGSDRSMCLYDVRTGKAEKRVIMQVSGLRVVLTRLIINRCGQTHLPGLQQCPAYYYSHLKTTIYTPLIFVHSLPLPRYGLLRDVCISLTSTSQIYKGHVSAAITCDWSPTGTEFVSGGWDRTVRIWKEGDGNGKEGQVYHGKRMQR